MMKAISRRLDRLEERLGTAGESEATRRLRVRLNAARLRSESPPVSPDRLAKLSGMSVAAILNSSRQPVSAQLKFGKTTPEFD